MAKLLNLVVIGAGGFGPEIVWAAENTNSRSEAFKILGFCDDNPEKKGQQLYGYPVLGTPEEAAAKFAEKPCFLCAIGNNDNRAKAVKRALALGWTPVSVVDPSVVVSKTVKIGNGTYVGAGSILSPQAQLGDYVVVNHHCSIGHDSRLADFVQISPGARVSGGCILEIGATLGSNAALAPKVKVGAHAMVGACSFAVQDVPAGATVIGNPARVLMRK